MSKFITAVALLVLAGSLAVVGQIANMPGAVPPVITKVVISARQIDYQRAEESAGRVLVANGCSAAYAAQAGRAAVDNGMSPQIVAAVVFVESSCNPDAVSPRGAIGLMGINRHVWRHPARELRDPEANTQIGTTILAGYVRAHGLREGLHRYNGLGDETSTYSARVLQVAYRR